MWLALQSLAGLAAICLAIYAAIAMGLESRQTRFLDEKTTLLAHLFAESSAADLRHRLDEFLLGHGDMSLVLRHADGTVFYARPPAGDVPRRAQRTRAIESALPGVPGAGRPRVSGQLGLSIDDDQVLLARIAWILVLASVIGAALISAGGFVLVRQGLRPLRLLTDQARQLSADTLHQRLLLAGQPDELRPLVEQFNALLERLEHAYQQLEGFNADVAHELCTPLANLIGGTEIALRRQRDAGTLRDTLGANLEELHRMASIVQDMLFLSRADRGALARRGPPASLAAVAQRVASYHEAELAEAGLGLRIRGDHVGALDQPLVERALSNLLSNAVRHADAGSDLCIDIVPGNGQVTLAVSNQGAPLDASHLPHLFDRFYRVDAARTDAARHHGLGLAIVSAVARMHGGQASAHSAQGRTTIGFSMDAEPGGPQAGAADTGEPAAGGAPARD
ncbi:hypothetical protein CCO03_04855 [Comamonas serinivorans]|uniref:Sensor protein n=2 Tax=Comamonas serinivorans TaxID=1082851 RepID=A0A1Y0EKC3_9BURK|nr:hypothetical protein CCO03_04855 [Comamonas serinivorans]